MSMFNSAMRLQKHNALGRINNIQSSRYFSGCCSCKLGFYGDLSFWAGRRVLPYIFQCSFRAVGMKTGKRIFLVLFFVLIPLFGVSADTGTLWIPCTAPLAEGDDVTLFMRPSTATSGLLLDLSTEVRQRNFPITSDVPYKIDGVCRGGLGIVSFSYPVNISFYDFACGAVSNTKSNEAVQGLVAVVCAALLWSAIILGMRS